MRPPSPPPPLLRIGETWDILGPFQIGTREAEWGADPLSHPRYGSFQALSPSDATFPSSLCPSGLASWSTADASCHSPESVSVPISFPEIDWNGVKESYGWAGLQFQAWARGTIEVVGTENKRVVIYVAGAASEFWVDSQKQFFGGDFYGFRRAPVVITLGPGLHSIDVRVSHDIRAFGGAVPPEVEFGVDVQEACPEGLVVEIEKALVSDVVDGKLVGQWASVPVRNECVNWIEILGVEGGDEHTKVSGMTPVRVAPGQSRPIKFKVLQIASGGEVLDLKFHYRREDWEVTVLVEKPLNFVENCYQPQKYTFLHPSGIVSSAVIRPPSPYAPCKAVPETKLPILIALHGAGVEADAAQNKESYNGLPDLCSWLLFPSGVTAWSGDDWHRWGFADVDAAVKAIPEWIKQVNWTRQGVALDKWVVSGHSNGGQGAWYALTHRNDKIIAAAPLSGYLSIPAYVPYTMWHEADPRKMAIVLASLNNYKHELLAPNVVGTPILQQHGEEDDNVPVYHSRRMHQLIEEAGGSSQYSEISGKGHWWEGVMTEGLLPEFLSLALNEHSEIPALPKKFSIVVANPANMASRGGIIVDQLEEPDRLGRIDVEISNNEWTISTANVRRWHFWRKGTFGVRCPSKNEDTKCPEKMILDGQVIYLPIRDPSETFLKATDGWVSSQEDWKISERSGRQCGGMGAFLSSQGTFTIVVPHESVGYERAVAFDISRNLYQYFAADTDIVDEVPQIRIGNIVLLANSSTELPSTGRRFPISVTDTHLSIMNAAGRTNRYKLEEGMGAIFLYPLLGEQLMLVVWGTDEAGLRAAARLVPLRTGVGQPDFIVVGRESGWAGVDGVKALGMFDSLVEVTPASFM